MAEGVRRVAGAEGGAAVRTPLRGVLGRIGRATDGIAGRIPYGQRVARAARGRLTRLLGDDLVALPHRDAYIVGYPKVGNTWFQITLRVALVRYYGLGDEWLSRVIYPQIGIAASIAYIDRRVRRELPAMYGCPMEGATERSARTRAHEGIGSA